LLSFKTILQKYNFFLYHQTFSYLFFLMIDAAAFEAPGRIVKSITGIEAVIIGTIEKAAELSKSQRLTYLKVVELL